MKTNKLTIILIIIIVILLGYIGYDKFLNNKSMETTNENEEELTLVDTINLDYVSIYLTSDGLAYISPISNEKINNINGGSNLKQRLNTLYERAFYYDIYIDNYRLKGFRVKLDSNIIKIRDVQKNDNHYIVFIKENNKIGLFNYDEYYNLMYTDVEDNYNKYENILDVIDNQIIYLDGSKEEFRVEE